MGKALAQAIPAAIAFRRLVQRAQQRREIELGHELGIYIEQRQPSRIDAFYVRAAVTSVCAKSSPLNNNGSSVTFAKAYAKQSPKFSFAACPLPLPKSR